MRLSNLYTDADDPLLAVVAGTVIDVVVHDNLVQRSRVACLMLHAELRRLQGRYGCVDDIRGQGLIAGIGIVSDIRTKEAVPGIGNTLSARMRGWGLLTYISMLDTEAASPFVRSFVCYEASRRNRPISSKF